MFNFSDIWIALFGATAKEAHEKEMREREERIDQTLAEFDSKKDEEQQYYLHLDEEQEREKEERRAQRQQMLDHVIGITMNVSSWNGKCVTQIFMATTRRIFKTEWTTLTNEKKEKIGKK